MRCCLAARCAREETIAAAAQGDDAHVGGPTGDGIEMLKASAPQSGIHGDMDFTPRYRLLDPFLEGLVRACEDLGIPFFDMGAECDDAVERVVRSLSASAKPT